MLKENMTLEGSLSKERELLERVVSGDDDGDFFISHRLYKDIETFLAKPEQEPDIDYFVKEIHKKCFHQSLDTAPVITVRDALSIFRKFLKNKRTCSKT